MHTNAPEGISRNHLIELAKKTGLVGGYRTAELLDAVEGYARVVLADKAVQEAFVAANQHLLKVGAGETAHDWKCVSPGEYDTLYECAKCGARHMEQADLPGSERPKFGCTHNRQVEGAAGGLPPEATARTQGSASPSRED